MVQQILDGAGYFSESDLGFKILDLCGLDVMGWMKERFVGDFGAIARAKNAIEALGEFDEVAATNVAEGTAAMLASWTGNAADGAHSYFDQLANAIESRGAMLGRLKGRYTAVLVGVQELGASLEGAITGANDAGFEAAAALGSYDIATGLPATSYYNPSQGPAPKHEDDSSMAANRMPGSCEPAWRCSRGGLTIRTSASWSATCWPAAATYARSSGPQSSSKRPARTWTRSNKACPA